MATRIHIAASPAGNTNLAGSFFLHVLFAGSIVLFAYMHHAFGHSWGDNNQNVGAIQASMVDAIPLPSLAPPTDNVLATDNPSKAPAPLTPATVAKPQPDEVLIQNKVKPTKIAERTTPQILHPQTVAPSNRIPAGEAPGMRIAVSTEQLAVGTSLMSVPAGDFGSRYAYYVNGMHHTVTNNWWQQEADPRASNGRSVTLLFDVLRDGTPTNVRVEKASNSPSLDLSAKHALQRVESFGPLPDTYRGDRITVEYTFDYQLH
jgi:periplasmic protein TonB